MIVMSLVWGSSSFVVQVTRRSWKRRFSPARLRAVRQAVRQPLVGRVGSIWRASHQGKTWCAGFDSGKRPAPLARASNAIGLRGMTRPVPASVFDAPTLTGRRVQSTCFHWSIRTSFFRMAAFSASSVAIWQAESVVAAVWGNPLPLRELVRGPRLSGLWASGLRPPAIPKACKLKKSGVGLPLRC